MITVISIFNISIIYQFLVYQLAKPHKDLFSLIRDKACPPPWFQNKNIQLWFKVQLQTVNNFKYAVKTVGREQCSGAGGNEYMY